MVIQTHPDTPWNREAYLIIYVGPESTICKHTTSMAAATYFLSPASCGERERERCNKPCCPLTLALSWSHMPEAGHVQLDGPMATRVLRDELFGL